MEKTKTVEIMTRIKQHYQEFIIDDYKIEEWHKELLNYDFEDVNEQLDKHLRSEQYGSFIPKLYFLTKYLKTVDEKNTNKQYFFRCSECGKITCLNDFDSHMDKCNSINYLIKVSKKYYGKEVTREQLEKLSNEEFQRKYWQIVENIDKDQLDLRQKGAWENAILTHYGYEPNINAKEII